MRAHPAPSARTRLIEILAERIVAEWLAESPPLESAPVPPHNVTHDKANSPTARRHLQPVQLG